MSKKKNPLFLWGRIEKSVFLDHHLSSLGNPRDAKRRSSGPIFLSYHHTHDEFLCSSGTEVHLDLKILTIDLFICTMNRTSPVPEVIKLFSCSTQLSVKFQLLIKTKMLKRYIFPAFKLSYDVYVLRKVGIDTILEWLCAK